MPYDIIPNLITSDDVLSVESKLLPIGLTEGQLIGLGINYQYVKSKLVCMGIADISALESLMTSDPDITSIVLQFIVLLVALEDRELSDLSISEVDDGYVRHKVNTNLAGNLSKAIKSKLNNIATLLKTALNIPTQPTEPLGIGVSKPTYNRHTICVENTT